MQIFASANFWPFHFSSKSAIIDRIYHKRAQRRCLNIDASATVSVSGTFLAWLFQYAGGMYLRGPAEVKRMYEDMIHVTSAYMEGDVFTENEAPGWKL